MRNEDGETREEEVADLSYMLKLMAEMDEAIDSMTSTERALFTAACYEIRKLVDRYKAIGVLALSYVVNEQAIKSEEQPT